MLSARLPITLLLLTGTFRVAAQQPRPADSEPVRWLTIEIVTNDFDSIQPLRAAIGIRPGAILTLGDPRVRQACDAVRRKLPTKIVRCTTLTPSKIDGYVEAEYVVEVSDQGSGAPPAPPHCISKELAPDLAALRIEWGRSLCENPGWGATERVNANHYLDYESPTLHPLAMRIHAAVSVRVADLEKAAAGCVADSRAFAVYLMNFTGFPRRAIRAASLRMLDPDPDVRNAAMRLLGVFNESISTNEAPGILTNACAALISGGFTDRNKSLVLLDRMRLRRLVTFGSLNRRCRAQVRNIARTSTAPQTGLAAQDLVGSTHRPDGQAVRPK
jgi:hypothetical protein